MPETDKMEVQDARVLLYPGHDVAIKSCTPAQYYTLTKLHAEGAKTAEPVTLTGKLLGYAQSVESHDDDGKPIYRPRTAREEVARLKSMYGGQVDKQGKRMIDKLFPDDVSPKVPLTFAEAKKSLVPIPVAATNAGDIGTATDVPGSLPEPVKPKEPAKS